MVILEWVFPDVLMTEYQSVGEINYDTITAERAHRTGESHSAKVHCIWQRSQQNSNLWNESTKQEVCMGINDEHPSFESE